MCRGGKASMSVSVSVQEREMENDQKVRVQIENRAQHTSLNCLCDNESEKNEKPKQIKEKRTVERREGEELQRNEGKSEWWWKKTQLVGSFDIQTTLAHSHFIFHLFAPFNGNSSSRSIPEKERHQQQPYSIQTSNRFSYIYARVKLFRNDLQAK